MPDPTPPSPAQHPTGQVDLDEVRRRVEAATPGPWDVLRDVEDVDNPIVRAAPAWFEEYGSRQYGVRFVAELAEGNLNDADAEFIAHARDDVPALLADLDAAREALRRAQPVLDAVGEMIAERNARHVQPSNPEWWSGWDFQIVAAWDVYSAAETQEGTDGN